MNLETVSALLGWDSQQVKLAIEEGAKLPTSRKRINLTATPTNDGLIVSAEDLDKFLAVFEAEKPGTTPPLKVRNNLLEEAHHKCAVCKEQAPLVFHHIVSFKSMSQHNPEHMIAVCGTCREIIHLGIVDSESLYKYKQPQAKDLEHYVPLNLPFGSEKCFVGREIEMNEVEKYLEQNSLVIIKPRSTEQGGVGKSQLALEYAYRHKDDYPGGLLWIRGSDDVITEFCQLVEPLRLPLQQEIRLSKRCHHVLQYLQQKQKKTLLILDNLDDANAYERIRQFLPTSINCHILITTSRDDIEGPSLSLDVLSDDEAQKLLKFTSDRLNEDRDAAVKICRVLGNLPLSIKLTGSFLKSNHSEVSFAEYYVKLIEIGLDHRPQNSDKYLHQVDHLANLSTILKLHTEDRTKFQIRKVLSALICFAPENINPKLLTSVSGLDSAETEILNANLADHSIIRIQADGRITIHSLMQEAIRRILPPLNLEKQNQYVVQLVKWFKVNSDAIALPMTIMEIPHIIKAAELALEKNFWPHSYALCINLGKHYKLVGRSVQRLKWVVSSKSRNVRFW